MDAVPGPMMPVYPMCIQKKRKAHPRLMYTLSPINVLHPHMMKNGGSMLTLPPKCPSMVFATAIRLAVSDASVLPSGMLSSLNACRFLIIASLNSPSSGIALAEKLEIGSGRVSKELGVERS